MEQLPKKRGRGLSPKASKAVSKAQEQQAARRANKERERLDDAKKAGGENLDSGLTNKGDAGSARAQSKSPGASSAAAEDGDREGSEVSGQAAIDGSAEVKRGQGRPRKHQQSRESTPRKAAGAAAEASLAKSTPGEAAAATTVGTKRGRPSFSTDTADDVVPTGNGEQTDGDGHTDGPVASENGKRASKEKRKRTPGGRGTGGGGAGHGTTGKQKQKKYAGVATSSEKGKRGRKGGAKGRIAERVEEEEEGGMEDDEQHGREEDWEQEEQDDATVGGSGDEDDDEAYSPESEEGRGERRKRTRGGASMAAEKALREEAAEGVGEEEQDGGEEGIPKRSGKQKKGAGATLKGGGSGGGEGGKGEAGDAAKKSDGKAATPKSGRKTKTVAEARRQKKKSVKKAKKSFKWCCPRCGSSFKVEAGAKYHIEKRVCDKVLERMRYNQGMYWDGKQVVPIRDEDLNQPPGSFSPDFPTLHSLGWDDDRVEKATAKSAAEGVAFDCETCKKSFSSKAGWRYHVTTGVCCIGTQGEDLADFSAQKTPRRKAAAKAASMLAAVSRDSSQNGGGGGSGGESMEAFDPTAVSDQENFSDEGENGGGKGRGSSGSARKKSPKRGGAGGGFGSLSGFGASPKPSDVVLGSCFLTPTSAAAAVGTGSGRGRHPLVRARLEAKVAAVAARAVLGRDLEPEGKEAESGPGVGGVEKVEVRSWRGVPELSQWVSGRGEGGGAVGTSPPWKTTTLAAWAVETRGGGGEDWGRLLPNPIRVEMVAQGSWNAAGFLQSNETPSAKRICIPPLQSVSSSPPDGKMPEVVLNACGSVWDIDTLVRPEEVAKAGRSGGATSCGSEMFLAVGTGPFRQTDDPLHEEDVYAPSLDSRSPLPILGTRATGPNILQVWRGKDASRKLAPAAAARAGNTEYSPGPGGKKPPKKARVISSKTKRQGKKKQASGGENGEGDGEGNAGDDQGGMFEFAYGIAHDGGGVLKCKWAPEAGDTGSEEALGLLAGVFYDGSLRVYVCPNPEEVSAAARAAGGVRSGFGTSVLLEMSPVLHASLKRAPLTCLDWNKQDANLLLAGAADGSVCIWKVSGGGGGPLDAEGTPTSNVPFRQFSCAAIGVFEPMQSVINEVVWCPESRDLFAATGAGHLLSVWDVSETFDPLCCIPLRATRCQGANLRWGPGRSGIWITGTSRPFLFFLDFFHGGMREVVYRVAPLPAKHQHQHLPVGSVEDVMPIEDAVWGLDVLREDSRGVAGALGQHIHLAAWTAPSGQVRISASGCRESSTGEHHHLAAAYLKRLNRTKKSQCAELKENRVMHRLEYVRPGDPLVEQGAPWSVDGSMEEEATTRLPFLRVFVGCQSEGKSTVKWREAAAPVAGLLHAVRLAHVPPPRPQNANDKSANTRSTCILLSGGHGGLVRCSAIPSHVPLPRVPLSLKRPKQLAEVRKKGGPATPPTKGTPATVKTGNAVTGKATVATVATAAAAAAVATAAAAAATVTPGDKNASAAVASGGEAGTVVAGTAILGEVPTAGAGVGTVAGAGDPDDGAGVGAVKRGRPTKSKPRPGPVEGDSETGKRPRPSR